MTANFFSVRFVEIFGFFGKTLWCCTIDCVRFLDIESCRGFEEVDGSLNSSIFGNFGQKF